MLVLITLIKNILKNIIWIASGVSSNLRPSLGEIHIDKQQLKTNKCQKSVFFYKL